MRQSFVVVLTGALGIETQIELIVPAEFKARLRQRIVPKLCPWPSLRQIGCVSRDFVTDDAHANVLTLYGQSFTNRLLLGTARYDSPSLLAAAVRAAKPAMLTVSLRRQLSGSKESGQSFWNLLRETRLPILPNTAGCLTAREAVQTARMARELFQTDAIKLEVIGDEVTLQPDPFGLVEAAMELVKLGFQVLPYCTEDWVLCRRLIDAGCQVLMPWAAPIGTGQGPRNVRGLRELRERAPEIPLIVDAGIGLPSHACRVMEWGFDGVLTRGGPSPNGKRLRPGSSKWPQRFFGRANDRA
jgi:thiazole synthase